MWIGVDYGSKLAGTTVVCYRAESGKVVFLQSEVKKDADKFLSDILVTLKPEMIYFDAPLSLPSAYFGKGEDYFYRSCDRALKAMSPMFLGGLTARAMRLAAHHPEVKFVETYPGYFIREVLNLSTDYQKRKSYNDHIAQEIIKQYDLNLTQSPDNWHQLDALACWISGQRAADGSGLCFGEEEEGLICV